MKEIKYASHFARNYKQRIARDEQLVRDFRESIEAFLENRTLVDDHPLEAALHAPPLLQFLSKASNKRPLISGYDIC